MAPQTGFTPKQPSAQPLISATPVQRTATQYGPVGHGESQGYNSSSDPPDYSFAMQATPDHLVYTVNPQGEVTGGGSVEISLQSIPATTMDQNCDPWMVKLEFFSETHYERLPSGALVVGHFFQSQFNTLELPSSQSCYFDISVPFQKNFGDDYIAGFCDPDRQSSGKPTEVVVVAKTTKVTVVWMSGISDSYGNPISARQHTLSTDARVTLPISIICENAP